MSDTATIATKQNPLQYVTDELKNCARKGSRRDCACSKASRSRLLSSTGKKLSTSLRIITWADDPQALRKARWMREAVRSGCGGRCERSAGTMKIHMELAGADRGVQERGSVRGVSVGIYR